jgi:CheY-like chemotaxis protein
VAKMLVIDDSPVMRRLLCMMLGAKHHDVAAAADATSAVTVAQSEKPDLIILDLSLPGGVGFLLIDRFRNLSRFAVVPINCSERGTVGGGRGEGTPGGRRSFLHQAPQRGGVLDSG